MQPELFWHQRRRFNICFTYHTQKVHRFLSNIRFEWKETAKTNGRKTRLSVDSQRHHHSVSANGWDSGTDWKSQLNSSLFTKIPGAEYMQVERSRGSQGSTGPLTVVFQTQFHTLLPHSLAPLGGNLHTATPNNSRSGFQKAGLEDGSGETVHKRRRSQPGNKLAKENFSNFHEARILH